MGVMDKLLQTVGFKSIVLKKSFPIDQGVPDIRKEVKNAMNRGKVISVLEDVNFVLDKVLLEGTTKHTESIKVVRQRSKVLLAELLEHVFVERENNGS